MILLGCGRQVLALFTLSTSVIGMFQHAKIQLRLGPLNWIFSMTELHRWHHSRDKREGNSNYGANLIVWDVLFGTRFLPEERELDPEHIGISNMPNFPQRYLGQLMSPFNWKRLRDSARDQAAVVEGHLEGNENRTPHTRQPHFLHRKTEARTSGPVGMQLGEDILRDP